MGTKSILSFYVESVARHLGAGRDGTNDLVAPTKNALSGMAAIMAAGRCDHVARADAEGIANSSFSSFPPPSGLNWLDVLLRNGLLRLDPDPQVSPRDPLQTPLDVVRFSFQRFQDHLIADVLLKNVTDSATAFSSGGALGFILNGTNIAWQWRGLIDALATQMPERFGRELVDSLPGNVDQWWQDWSIQSAFSESVRWREKRAFTKRTLDLFNRLNASTDTRFSLLIELSASVDHPWNADLIHKNLLPKKLPERDAFWSIEMNDATDEETHPIHRLIDWCRHGQNAGAVEETQRLCAFVLSWCFALSSRPIRDQATKALASLFLARKSLFSTIVAAFKGVDDLYVWERIFAAAYGACCVEPNHEALSDYAAIAFDVVFVSGHVPEHVLLRDYARGIVELAAHNGVLPKSVDISRARPPYGSPIPKLSVSEAHAKRAAKKAGNDAILSSCSGFTGDFGTYTLTHAVNHFTTVKLSNPIPYTAHEFRNRFESEVVNITEARARAWQRLRDAMTPRLDIVIRGVKRAPRKPVRANRQNSAQEIKAALSRFLSLLTPREQSRFMTDAAAYMGFKVKAKRIDPPTVDLSVARRWVAVQAYALGWTHKRFPKESASHYSPSRDRPQVERIGKKYQWLALNQLLCRLADNYWMGGGISDGTRKYENSIDIGFFRDIDPTVLEQSVGMATQHAANDWMYGLPIQLPDTDEVKLGKWPFLSDPAKALPQLIYRTDTSGRSWTALYDHYSRTGRYDRESRGSSHTMRQQEFRFVLSVVIKKSAVGRFVRDLSRKRSIDVMWWDPPEFIDGPFLRESPWRAIWEIPQWEENGWSAPKGLSIARPVYEYRWESHLDASLPDGASSLMPATWLVRDMKLERDRQDAERFLASDDSVRFIASRAPDSRSSALIDAKSFADYLNNRGLACVWLFVAERNAWPGGDNTHAAWRRSEGCCWLHSNGKPKSKTWYRDQINSPTASRRHRVGRR